MSEQSDLMTARECAARLRVSKATIYRWLGEGRLPGVVDLGPRALRFRRSEIDRLINDRLVR